MAERVYSSEVQPFAILPRFAMQPLARLRLPEFALVWVANFYNPRKMICPKIPTRDLLRGVYIRIVVGEDCVDNRQRNRNQALDSVLANSVQAVHP
jgi:hypothetical protein